MSPEPTTSPSLTDPLALTEALIARPSVTPLDAGALDVIGAALDRLGFTVTRLRYGEIENLFARIGGEGPHFCYAGHSDVVPSGDATGWRSDPFAPVLRDGVLYGRGACDMKGAIAAFIAATAARLEQGKLNGSLSLLITGDEEGVATDGTVRVLDWMAEHNQIPDFCLVGEPTSKVRLGDTVKIGRRGSMNARITVRGRQGHVAYPQRADNPVHRLVRAVAELTAQPLDTGTDWFEPSSLQLTSIDVGNAATNVIPASAEARLNIRFNELHDSAKLSAMLRRVVDAHAPESDVTISVSGESFLTQPGPEVDRLRAAIARETGIDPALDTGGGTSDARFISRFCKVAEFGLVGASMHQVDECVPVAELHALTRIYGGVLREFLG